MRRGPSPGRSISTRRPHRVIDDPRAYRALIDAIEHHDPAQADVVRRETVWTHGRTVRQSLMFTPHSLLEYVEEALAAISEG